MKDAIIKDIYRISPFGAFCIMGILSYQLGKKAAKVELSDKINEFFSKK